MPVGANEVFFQLPPRVLQGVFDDGHACLDIGSLTGKKPPGALIRAVCSWHTTDAHVDGFLASVRRHAAEVCGIAPPAAAAAPCTLPWREVAPGSKHAYRHRVEGEGEGGEAGLPVLVARGAKPGPVLLTIAGVHGDEFEPMAAVHDLRAAGAALEPGLFGAIAGYSLRIRRV